jgi:hypothetical protein
MASTIKVNNIQNQCGANIANKCGTTITLGASGDTITLACGASQTGFGRTGTVDWDTTAKTASFTAVSGNGYFVNTTSGAITLTLPASPSAGDIVSVKDYAYTFATNNLTVARNGSPIGGGSDQNVVYSTNGTSKTFIYVDGTQGWLVTNESTDTSSGETPAFVTATGGTITCCGDYKIHTFTGPGTFTVSCAGNSAGSETIDYLVVAAGGGGGASGGGGGAGGYRESSGAASGCYTVSPLGSGVSALPVSIQGYPITVGAGGTGGASPATTGTGTAGGASIFSTITSAGGGGGANHGGCNGGSGGSGGGAGRDSSNSGGSGNTPPVSPPQGNAGGNGPGSSGGPNAAAGGGGATAASTTAPTNGPGTAGGAGATSSINGTPTARAGGGGGGAGTAGPGGAGGTGGGGNGGGPYSPSPIPGTNGTANLGGGGGGGSGSGGAGGVGGDGGSGIVIIRYKYQ